MSVSKISHLMNFTVCLCIYFIRSLDDPRLLENDSCLQWVLNWEKYVNSLVHLKPKERNKKFLSFKTKFDVQSMILGFKSYCNTLFSKFPGSEANVLLSNQNALENFFVEHRAQNGQADNPTVLQIGNLRKTYNYMKLNLALLITISTVYHFFKKEIDFINNYFQNILHQQLSR